MQEIGMNLTLPKITPIVLIRDLTQMCPNVRTGNKDAVREVKLHRNTKRSIQMILTKSMTIEKKKSNNGKAAALMSKRETRNS